MATYSMTPEQFDEFRREINPRGGRLEYNILPQSLWDRTDEKAKNILRVIPLGKGPADPAKTTGTIKVYLDSYGKPSRYVLTTEDKKLEGAADGAGAFKEGGRLSRVVLGGPGVVTESEMREFERIHGKYKEIGEEKRREFDGLVERYSSLTATQRKKFWEGYEDYGGMNAKERFYFWEGVNPTKRVSVPPGKIVRLEQGMEFTEEQYQEVKKLLRYVKTSDQYMELATEMEEKVKRMDFGGGVYKYYIPPDLLNKLRLLQDERDEQKRAMLAKKQIPEKSPEPEGISIEKKEYKELRKFIDDAHHRAKDAETRKQYKEAEKELARNAKAVEGKNEFGARTAAYYVDPKTAEKLMPIIADFREALSKKAAENEGKRRANR